MTDEELYSIIDEWTLEWKVLVSDEELSNLENRLALEILIDQDKPKESEEKLQATHIESKLEKQQQEVWMECWSE